MLINHTWSCTKINRQEEEDGPKLIIIIKWRRKRSKKIDTAGLVVVNFNRLHGSIEV